MTRKDGHVEFAGWVVHLEAAVQDSPIGYDEPGAVYGLPGVVYGGIPNELNWRTLDCELTRVTCDFGGRLDRIPGVRAELGSLTAELYDPNRALDPSATPFQLLTKPGAAVRLTATNPTTGQATPLWTGRSTRWEHDLAAGTGVLEAEDNVSLFSGVDVANWQRPAESSITRLRAVLDILPIQPPSTFSGVATQMSAASISADLWSAAVIETGEAAQAMVWVDQTGRFRYSDVSLTGQAIAATDCDDGTTTLIYTRLSSLTDDDLLANMVLCDRVGLPDSLAGRDPLVYSNATSVNLYGPHSITKTDLTLPDDAALQAWAGFILDLRGTPTAAISGMSIEISDVHPWVNRTIPALVGLQIGSVLDVTLTSRGTPGRWPVMVAGIKHTIIPDSWVCDIELADGAKIAANAGYDAAKSVYNVTVYGRTPGVAPALAGGPA